MNLRSLYSTFALVGFALLSLVAVAADAKPAGKPHAVQFSGEFYLEGKVTVAPKPEKTVAPRYPVEMRRAGREGVARVAFIVTADGFVEEARVVDATGPGFGPAAIEAVKQWHFTPGELNGRRVRVAMVRDFPFTLGGKAKR